MGDMKRNVDVKAATWLLHGRLPHQIQENVIGKNRIIELPLAVVISCPSRASCIFRLPDANVESEGGTADRWYRRLLRVAWATRDLQLPSIARYLRPNEVRRESRVANRVRRTCGPR